MPIMSAVGNRRPTSTTTIRSSYSTTVMFLPISPSPPSGRTRKGVTLRLPPVGALDDDAGPPARRNRSASPSSRGGDLEQPMALEHRPHRLLLPLVGLDERQAQAADAVAEHVQRGLDADRVGGQEQRLVDVPQGGVDLGAALG